MCISLLRVSLQAPNNSEEIGPGLRGGADNLYVYDRQTQIDRFHRDALEARTNMIGDKGLSRHG